MDLSLDTILTVVERKTRSGDIAHYQGYSEPGYYLDDDKDGILLSDWNGVPERILLWLEKRFDLHWDDEWTYCDECHKIVKTSPSSYFWKQSYIWANDDCIICKECVLSSEEEQENYIKTLINDPKKVELLDLDLESMGFEKLNDHSFENGLHRGMDDDPQKILDKLLKQYPNGEFVFCNFKTSQFYITFDIYGRNLEGETADV